MRAGGPRSQGKRTGCGWSAGVNNVHWGTQLKTLMRAGGPRSQGKRTGCGWSAGVNDVRW